MLFFLMGAAAGALAVYWLGMKARARADRLEEEKLRLAQEKQIVVDFMHHMVQALGEGLSREELFQRIVHAAILCTEALSACIFEKTAAGVMRGVAVEGLFPPHRPVNPGSATQPMTPSALNKAIGRLEWGMEHFTVHDLRRTGSTALNEKGYPADVIEKALNHSVRGIRGIYNKAQYAEQRKKMLAEWAGWLEGLKDG